MSAPDFAKIVQSQPWYERAIAAVAPDYGLKRMQARVQQHLFAYQAAQADRIYAPRTYGSAAETVQTERSRVVMMWEALDLVENFPLAKAAISRFGLFLTPTEYAPATGDRDYDALIADYFHQWCKRADATARHSFRKLMQLAAEMRPAYGDVGFALRRVDGELKLQLIPGDRIGNPNEILFSDMGDGRFYYSGVITDKIGRPLAYRVFRINDSNAWVDPEEIGAGNFCHYFDPFRVDQYRGVTDFHAVARTARMLKEILDAEMAGVRFASQNAALVFTERGQAASRNLFTPSATPTLPNGERPAQEMSDIANVKYLYQGDKVEIMPSRPGTAFNGFVQTLMNDIALGLGGYPTGVLWGTQDFKGPSVRAEFAQADRVNSRHQGILSDKVLDPVKNAVILDAIARQVLPAPPRESGESLESAVIRATRGTFRFPPRLTIDVGRESAARISELNNGAGSLQEIAAEDGRDAFTRLEEKAQAAAWIKELSDKYDVPETAIILPGGQLPSTPTAAAAVGEKAGEDASDAQAASVARDDMPEANLSRLQAFARFAATVEKNKAVRRALIDR
jgi:capsid protein